MSPKLLLKLNLILFFILGITFFTGIPGSFAYPFNRIDRMDINSADLYDFMDLPEVDYLTARKIMERRKDKGEFEKIEDLTEIISPELFNIICDTVEVGSFKGPRDQFFNGNSFSDIRWDMERDKSYTTKGRYNFYLSNRIFTRIAYNKGTFENNLNFNEVFLDFYTWSDGFIPKNFTTVPRPKSEIRQRIIEKADEMENRVLSDFDSRYGHELLIGRRRKKKVHGLFDTDLNSYQKYWLTKKPKEKKKKRRKKIIKEEIKEEPKKKINPDNLMEYRMKIPKKNEKEEEIIKNPVMTGIFSLGNVSHHRSPYPLIDLHRTLYQGVKYERIMDNFRASVLYQKDDDNEMEILGGNAYAYLKESDVVLGMKAHKLYHKPSDNDVNLFSFYAMGDMKETNTHLYGEYQAVFEGASSLYGRVSSHFRDLYITTEILSVKEDFGGPNHVTPYSFDGEFTSSLRLTYNFSGISSIYAQIKKSELKDGDPDVDIGNTKQSRVRLFLKATEKSLISLGYTRDNNVDATEDDTYFGRLRYRYKPNFHVYLTTSFTDKDVTNRESHSGYNSIDFRWRLKKNLKINLELIDQWDDTQTGTDEEHTSMARINYYYNF